MHVAALPDASGVLYAYQEYPEQGTGDHIGFATNSGTISKLDDSGDLVINSLSARSKTSYVLGGDNIDFGEIFNEAQAIFAGHIARIQLGSPVGAFDHISQASSADFLPDGGFVAIYDNVANVSGAMDDRQVLAIQYDADGNQIGKPTKIGQMAQPTQFHNWTAVGTDADGSIVAAWINASDSTVHYRRLSTQDFAFTRGSELYLLGTPEDELLSVKKSGDKIIATRSRTSRSFDASKISALTINAYGDDDDIINQTGLRATIQGGNGNDTITSAASISLNIAGDDGNDRITVADNAAAHIFGGKGNDSLEGGAGKQFFDGQSGNDTINGGDGNDRITGGEGDDRLIGGLGDDIINAGPGKDYIDAGKGNDVINAKDGQADTLFGGAGNDSASVDLLLDVLDGVEVAS
jgi:Ca2+-binding RTX toxin-like protein